MNNRKTKQNAIRGKQKVRHRAVVLTAIPCEFEAVKRLLIRRSTHRMSDGTSVTSGRIDLHNSTWKIYCAEVGQGNSVAGAKTRTAIHDFKPEFCIFLGIAGTLKDADLSDVVVADRVYNYERAKAGKELGVRPAMEEFRGRLLETAKSLARQDYVNRVWEKGGATPRYKVIVGPIASGEKVVASLDAETYKFLQTHYNDAQAVETEGYGFAVAMRDYRFIHALLARGISDALEKKAESDRNGQQEIAAINVADFGFSCLNRVSLDTDSQAEQAGAWIQLELRFDGKSPEEFESDLVQHVLQEFDPDASVGQINRRGRCVRSTAYLSRKGLSRFRKSLRSGSRVAGALVDGVSDLQTGQTYWERR